CFLLNGVSYLAVIAALLAMKVKPRPLEARRSRILQELKEGFTYAFGSAPIRSIILLLALISLMGMPYVVLMPVFAKEILKGGANTLGFLMGFSGLGALTGALFLASRRDALGLVRLIPLAAGLFGVGLIAFSRSRVLWLSMLLMLVTGFGMMVQMASSNTVVQTIVDDSKRGRVMSFYMMAYMGMMPFGSLLGGSLANRIGAPDTLALGGVAVILGALLFASKHSAISGAVRSGSTGSTVPGS
ncbi:MAG: MFS transporter, partial [Eubacteriales bacterium]